MRKPTLLGPRSCDGSAETPELVVPRGNKRVTISPRSAVTVQVSFIQNGSNTPGQFFSLVSGQPFTFDDDDGFDEFKLFFFAGSAVIVDVVAW